MTLHEAKFYNLKTRVDSDNEEMQNILYQKGMVLQSYVEQKFTAYYQHHFLDIFKEHGSNMWREDMRLFIKKFDFHQVERAVELGYKDHPIYPPNMGEFLILLRRAGKVKVTRDGMKKARYHV